MFERATLVNLGNRQVFAPGEPILDSHDGVLIIAFQDGTSRVFNWDHVTDFYYMTEGETQQMLEEFS